MGGAAGAEHFNVKRDTSKRNKKDKAWQPQAQAFPNAKPVDGSVFNMTEGYFVDDQDTMTGTDSRPRVSKTSFLLTSDYKESCANKGLSWVCRHPSTSCTECGGKTSPHCAGSLIDGGHVLKECLSVLQAQSMLHKGRRTLHTEGEAE